MASRLAVLAAITLAVVAAAPGCGGKRKGAGPDGAAAAPGIGEEGVTPGGTLDRYRAGEDPGARTGERGPLKDIHFAFDSYDLDEEARSILQGTAEWLREHPKSRVEIEGHTDERGTVEYNLALGARRAKAAKDYLVTLGIAADRLATISYGEELPVCREHTEPCWADNRRCHFVVLEQ